MMRKAHRPSRPRVATKRAYEAAARSDGYRVLVDRLWPRGVTKAALSIDLWAKEVAPSGELRRWFGHDPARWQGFVERYRDELRAPAARDRLEDLARRAEKGRVTLVYGARDERHNDAAVIAGEVARRLRARTGRAARRGAA